ncbi:unnamed protein product [Sphagnum jensenii]
MYFGVNFSGAEFGNSTDGAYNWNANLVWFPQGHYDYFKGKGFNAIRLCISWDALQPNINYGFAAPYLANVQAAIDMATKDGLTVILDVHNYARKNGDIIGSAALPNSAFADLWTRLANLYKGYSNLIMAIMNEPHDMATSQWISAANAAIAAIRATGATNMILVPGNYWSGTESWTGGEMGGIVDPGNNWNIDVHCYLNSNGSGAVSDVVSPTILKDRMTPLTNWCKANGKKYLLTETSTGPTDPNAKPAITDGLTYFAANSDVCLGWFWWANIGTAPPNDPYTPYAINPSLDYKTDDAKIAWLTPFMTATPPPVVTPPATNIVATANNLACPSDQGYTAYLVNPTGNSVPAGKYPLGIYTRTTYASTAMFVDQFILSNPSTLYDLTWKSITLDLRGHTISSFWDCTVTGTSGVVTITPTTDSQTVLANGRNAFGIAINRQTGSGASYQALVKKVSF